MSGPLRELDRWDRNIGRAWAEGLKAGIEDGQFELGLGLSRVIWRLEEDAARRRAEAAERHADWFASLPWWRRLWALVWHQ